MKRLTTVIVGLLLMTVVRLDARSLTGYTAEWISHDSDLIIEGAVKSGEMTFFAGDTFFTKVRFTVLRVLKGPLTPGDEVTIWGYRQKDPLGLTKESSVGRKLLVFSKIAENTFRELDGRYIFGDYGFVQTTFDVGSDPIFELGGRKYWFYSEDCLRVPSYDALVDRVHAQVSKEYELRRSYWGGTIEMRKIDAPMGSVAQRDLPGMSGTFIMAPEYKEAKK
jgi:hypothetical protein